MELDLDRLQEMHPLLPLSTAVEYGHRAAVGLGRHGHLPGVAFLAAVDSDERPGLLHWTVAPSSDSDLLDQHRVTEEAAEAVALALVHRALGWVVRRRLQRGEAADWLLLDREHERVALEVGGIDRGDGGRRLREKIEQVRRSTLASRKAACVVELAAPRATLASLQREEPIP